MVPDSAKPPQIDTSSFARLIWPVGILLVEATALTPFVEFRGGKMTLLAHPLMLSAGIVTLVIFFLLVISNQNHSQDVPTAETEAAQPPQHGISFWLREPWRSVDWKWLLGHLTLLAVFVWLSLMIHSMSRQNGVSSILPAIWIALGFAVACTIVRTFLPLRDVGQLVRKFALQAIIAGVIGISLLLMITPLRNLWPLLDGPMLVVLEGMFNVYPGNANVDTITFRWPIIGASTISLLVTPPCSELESLLVFVLLGGTLWVAKWEDLAPWRFLLVMLGGLCAIYALLIFRLYLLVVIGVWAKDPYVSVGLAHSRVSTLGLLIFSLVVLSIGSKLAVRPEPIEYDPEQYSEEVLDEAESEEPEEELATNDA